MPTVLLVQGDDIIRVQLTDLLGLQGVSVKLANNGMEALDHLQRAKPDLVVIDLQLTGMDGWDLARRIRGDRKTLDTPVMFLSNGAASDERLRAMRLGVDDVVGKHLGPEEAVARVRRCMANLNEERKVAETSRQYRSGFAGDLAILNVSGLLSLMSAEKKTGSLQMKNDAKEGVLLIRDGRLVHALLKGDNIIGPEAAIEMLSWEEGQFFFTWEPISVDDRMGIPIAHLVIEAARLADERKRDQV